MPRSPGRAARSRANTPPTLLPAVAGEMAHAPPPTTIEHLAPELLHHVLSFLPSARDLCRATSVNSTWRRRVQDNEEARTMGW